MIIPDCFVLWVILRRCNNCRSYTLCSETWWLRREEADVEGRTWRVEMRKTENLSQGTRSPTEFGIFSEFVRRALPPS